MSHPGASSLPHLGVLRVVADETRQPADRSVAAKRARSASGSLSAPAPPTRGVPAPAAAALAACVDPALAADRRRWFPAEYASWRKERRAAWDVLPEQPDAYYLKYLPPGERGRECAWSDEEEATFLRMLGERRFAYEGKWGLFSMYIRGRTGLQCKAFYEGLAKAQKLGAARRGARQRAAPHAANGDSGADAPPEPIARMTAQRAQRRRIKEATAAALVVEASPPGSDNDADADADADVDVDGDAEVATDEPIARATSPEPGTPPTAEPTAEPVTSSDADSVKPAPATAKAARAHAADATPATSDRAPASTPAPAHAALAPCAVPECTPLSHRQQAEHEARASAAPTARAAPRMQHKESARHQPPVLLLPMPLPLATTPAAAEAAAAASAAHGAMLARALAAAAARPPPPARPAAGVGAQPAPAATGAPAASEAAARAASPRAEPTAAPAAEAERGNAGRAAGAPAAEEPVASGGTMAALVSACELVLATPTPPSGGGLDVDGGEVQCLARPATSGDEALALGPERTPCGGAAEDAQPHDSQLTADALPTLATSDAPPAPRPPLPIGEDDGQPHGAAHVESVAVHAAPSGDDPAICDSEAEPCARSAVECYAPRIDFSAETAAPVDVCASAPHGLALPAPASLARKSPPSLKLSPGKGRALFLAQLRAHHDYCQLQQARLAMVEAEQHEALRLRLAGHISPFERACAALASDSAKRFKALHSNAAAWSERAAQGARSELARGHEATRAAMLAQHRMEASALRAMSAWLRQREQGEGCDA